MPVSKIVEASTDSGLYYAKAWVNFNGTSTVAIRASGNVSSITDNGTGDYTVNFATAMPDANYSAIGMASNASFTLFTGFYPGIAPTTSGFRIATSNFQNSYQDAVYVQYAVFR